jgi:hypothetical protein
MGCAELGGWSRPAGVAAVGSYGAMIGAKMVTRMKMPTTVNPA